MRPVSLIMTIQHTHIHSLLYTPPNVLMYSHHIQFHPHCHLHCHPQLSHTLLSTLPPTWPPTIATYIAIHIATYIATHISAYIATCIVTYIATHIANLYSVIVCMDTFQICCTMSTWHHRSVFLSNTLCPPPHLNDVKGIIPITFSMHVCMCAPDSFQTHESLNMVRA